MSARVRRQGNQERPISRKDPESKWPAWVWFLLLMGVGTAVRLLYLAEIVHAPDIVSPILDSNWNLTEALRIVGGEWLPEGPFWRPPGYQYFLAPLLFLSRGDPLPARVVQVVMAGAVCGLIYLIGRRTFGHGVGLLAGSVAAVYGMLIYFSTELLATTLEIFINALLLIAVLVADERKTPGRWVVAGVLLGLSALIRPNILLFGIFLFLAVLGLKSWRSNWRSALALAVGILILVLPVTAINAFHGGDRVLIAAQGGANLYIGNCSYADGKSAILLGPIESEYLQTLGEYYDQVHMISTVVAEKDLGRELKASEVDRYWYAKTLDYVAKEPGHFVRLLFHKLYFFWNNHEVSNNRNIDVFLKQHAPWLRPPLPWFGLIAPLALMGMVVSWRRGRSSRLLVLYAGAQMVSLLLFFVCARFRMSAVIVLIVFASYALVWIVRKVREADWRRVGIAAVCLPLVFWIVHTGYLKVRDLAGAGIHYFNQAIAYTREARYEEALELLQLVVQHNPYDPMVHSAMGSNLLRMDRLEEARAAYDRAIAVNSSVAPMIHSDMGTYLASIGRIDEAEAELRAALKADPGFVHARLNLAGLLSNAGRPEEALPEFDALLARVPQGEKGKVLTEVAITLNMLGRRGEAIDTLRESIASDRTNARAHAILGGYLEAEGDLDGALEAWEQARQWARSEREKREAEEHLEALSRRQ